VPYGPWEAVAGGQGYGQTVSDINERSTNAFAVQDRSILSHLKDGILYNGAIYGIPLATTGNIATTEMNPRGFAVAGANNVALGYTTELTTNVALALLAWDDDGSTPQFSAHGTTILHTVADILWTRWGNVVYFGAQAANADLYKHTIGTTVITATTVVHAAQGFRALEIVDNNLVWINSVGNLLGGSVTVNWSVDGNPEDPTGVGSGSSLRDRVSPPVTGSALLGRRFYYIGYFGCEYLEPTGTLPAFRFGYVPEIEGTWVNGEGLAAYKGSLYYIGHDGRLTRYRNGQISKHPHDIVFIPTDTCNGVRSSELFGSIFVLTNTDEVYIFDPETLVCVGHLTSFGKYGGLGRANPTLGGEQIVERVVRSDGTEYAYMLGYDISVGDNPVPAARYGRNQQVFGNDVWLEYIDVHVNNIEQSLLPSLQLQIFQENGTADQLTTTPDVFGGVLRYHVNRSVYSCDWSVTGYVASTDAPTSQHGITKVVFVMQGHNPPADAVVMI
jgi:hypothetical protein